MGRFTGWLLGPRAYETAAERRDFTRHPSNGFQLDGTFGGLQATDALLEQIAGLSDDWVDRATALRVPAVLRARNLICSTAGTMTLELFTVQRERDDRRWLGVDPDPELPQSVVYSQTFEDLLFHGLCYWRPVDWLAGFPVSAQKLRKSSVSEYPSSVDPARVISDDLLFDPRAPITVNGVPEPRTIRFVSPNPPLLRYAARAIRTYVALDEAARRMAQNPIPLGYFTDAEGEQSMEDEEVQATLDRWEQVRRRRVWGYLERGLELHQMTAPTAEQLQLVESRNAAALEIARLMGIDPDYLGIPATTRTYANSESRRLDLVDFTMQPYLAAVEERLSKPDVTPRGLRARFAVDEFSRGDFSSRMAGYAAAKSSGVYQTNELRRRDYLPDIAEPRVNHEPVSANVDDVRNPALPGGPADPAALGDGRPMERNRAEPGL